MKNKILGVLLVVVSVLQPVSSFANSALEKAELARIKNILAATKPLINAAESNQQKDERIQFRYGWLRMDINKIIKGIDEKLNAIRIEPRVVKPLQGDYLDMRSKRR